LRTRDAYTAIADPTRRDILTLLRDRGTLLAGEIVSRFPDVSRPGISRHLRVLRECGVVTARRHGKHQNYSLNARPLQDISDGWLAGFAGKQTRSLAALRDRVENPQSDED
jgi:DNA-binding transcriptional ArsR family regulator